VPVVLMHIKGTPENMQNAPFYGDVVAEIKDYFQERIDYALSHGIKKEKIIIDPGIGFGKRLEDNIAIIRGLGEFREFDLPILVGLSRKRFLGLLSGENIPEKREAETVAANLAAVCKGADIIRVHDVSGTVKALKVWRSLTE
jgi:dihydropteroate synthase